MTNHKVKNSHPEFDKTDCKLFPLSFWLIYFTYQNTIPSDSVSTLPSIQTEKSFLKLATRCSLTRYAKPPRASFLFFVFSFFIISWYPGKLKGDQECSDVKKSSHRPIMSNLLFALSSIYRISWYYVVTWQFEWPRQSKFLSVLNTEKKIHLYNGYLYSVETWQTNFPPQYQRWKYLSLGWIIFNCP